MIDQATRDLICERIANGESLRAICRDPAGPGFTEAYWRKVAEQDPELGAQYTRAMMMRADARFEELDELGDKAIRAETAVQAAGYRLKADNLKWSLARMSPKKYGDKLEHSGQVGVAVTLTPGETGVL
jgi:hypothetical protein